jgi:hypothetical protein
MCSGETGDQKYIFHVKKLQYWLQLDVRTVYIVVVATVLCGVVSQCRFVLNEAVFFVCVRRRYTCIQSTGVGDRPPLSCLAGHRMVARGASVRYGVWWHPIWNWRTDRSSLRHFPKNAVSRYTLTTCWATFGYSECLFQHIKLNKLLAADLP